MTSRLSQSWPARIVHLGYLGPSFFCVEPTHRNDPEAKCSQLRAQVPPGIARVAATSRQGVVTSVASTLPRLTPYTPTTSPQPVPSPVAVSGFPLRSRKRVACHRRDVRYSPFKCLPKCPKANRNHVEALPAAFQATRKEEQADGQLAVPYFSQAPPKCSSVPPTQLPGLITVSDSPPLPPEEPQMTGARGRGGTKLAPYTRSLPASATEKIAQGPTTPRLNAKESSRNLASFLFTWQHFFQETRRINQTRGKYCELTCISKGKALMRLSPARMLLDFWALVGCLGHHAMRNKPMQLRLTF